MVHSLITLATLSLLGLTPSLSAHAAAASVVVHTAFGALRGNTVRSLGRPVHTFFGVPFAKPPVGQLRFRPPQPLSKWDDELPAFVKAFSCPQGADTTFGDFKGSDMWNAKNNQSEDCLRLNIWTPSIGRNEKLPVMVWLFGGGFWYGSASLDLYDGAALAASANVVVVAVNYRVGAFGFLYLNHSAVPGNMGVLDQRAALQFLQHSAAAFGGDANKVTLFGESAGAASITAHMLAPGSWHLFRDGILQSGTLDNNWSLDRPARALAKSWQVVQGAWCAPQDSQPTPLLIEAAIHCLRTRSPANLTDSIWNVKLNFLEFPLVLVSQDVNFFTEKDAFVQLREGPVKPDTNLIVGINQDEGTFWNIYYVEGFLEYWNREFGPVVDGAQFERIVKQAFAAHPYTVQLAAMHAYWNRSHALPHSFIGTMDRRADQFYFEQTNQMVGDYFFSCDALWWADQVVGRNIGKVWVYLFNQPSSHNPWPPWTGVMHGYEIEYVFGVPRAQRLNYKSHEADFSSRVMQIWGHFAAYRWPGAVWPLYDASPSAEWLYLRANNNTQPGSSAAAFGSQPTHSIPRQKVHECNMWRDVRDIEYRLDFMRELTPASSGAAGSGGMVNSALGTHLPAAVLLLCTICNGIIILAQLFFIRN